MLNLLAALQMYHSQMFGRQLDAEAIRGLNGLRDIGWYPTYATVIRTPGLFASAPPVHDSVKYVNMLTEFFDVWLCSQVNAPDTHPLPTAMQEQWVWVKTHLPGLQDKLMFTNDKGVIDARVLIDDDPVHLEKFGGLKILFSTPYNQSGSAFGRVRTWATLYKLLKEMI